jgi:hypothetical protein
MALVDQDPIIAAQGQLKEQMLNVIGYLESYKNQSNDLVGPKSFSGPAALQHLALVEDIDRAQKEVTARFEAAIHKLGENVQGAGAVDNQNVHDLQAVAGDGLRHV